MNEKSEARFVRRSEVWMSGEVCISNTISKHQNASRKNLPLKLRFGIATEISQHQYIYCHWNLPYCKMARRLWRIKILKWVYGTDQSISNLDISASQKREPKQLKTFQRMTTQWNFDSDLIHLPCPFLETVWGPQNFQVFFEDPRGLCVTSCHHHICSFISTLNSRKAMASSMHFGHSSCGRERQRASRGWEVTVDLWSTSNILKSAVSNIRGWLQQEKPPFVKSNYWSHGPGMLCRKSDMDRWFRAPLQMLSNLDTVQFLNSRILQVCLKICQKMQTPFELKKLPIFPRWFFVGSGLEGGQQQKDSRRFLRMSFEIRIDC